MTSVSSLSFVVAVINKSDEWIVPSKQQNINNRYRIASHSENSRNMLFMLPGMFTWKHLIGLRSALPGDIKLHWKDLLQQQEESLEHKKEDNSQLRYLSDVDTVVGRASGVYTPRDVWTEKGSRDVSREQRGQVIDKGRKLSDCDRWDRDRAGVFITLGC